MIIDIHAHLSSPPELYAYKGALLSHRGAHGRGRVAVDDDRIRAAFETPNPSFGNISHLDHIDQAGIDVQLISPRPYAAGHSEEPAKLVEWYTEETNNLIHRSAELYPDRFRGVAGLPQAPSLGPERWVRELRRAVQELGFVGVLLNPDPMEGTSPPLPALGDRYWYPVYEAMVDLGVPALIHSAACKPPARESYSLHFIVEETINLVSLVNSQVFDDFPELKVIVSHGGGAIPYQAGRFMPGALRGGGRPFVDRLRNVYFDSCLYTREALELLIRTVGADRILFGSEKPGTGSSKNPETGRWFDDIHVLLDEIEWLPVEEREAILHGNAEQLFRLHG
ncbi:amidohydrolase family protein [Agromyces archimandritae]|uniref:Amidohydrolase n=1 Tax=Agromyces archimandritae TaxID=2781962 RepID=A0A975FMT8_9MICO|nr:amidohydrolase family protein [Agromyces archimandritae]QTX04393.1 amidohydrolase [Agromyces archimandritae]